jgi:hypothetical protein
MQRWLHKILMLIAVATIVGHNCMPHHHHEEILAVAHHEHQEDGGTKTHHHDHQENKNEKHNIFSFAQLDEDFIPAKFQVEGFELPVLYLLTPEISFQLKLIISPSKAFNYYREYPPPGNYLSQLPSRGPPSLSNMA